MSVSSKRITELMKINKLNLKYLVARVGVTEYARWRERYSW